MGGSAAGGMLLIEKHPMALWNSGEAVAATVWSQLPVANPFHSERVKTKVELIRSRLGTLHADSMRPVADVDESALGDSAFRGSARRFSFCAGGFSSPCNF